MFLIKNCVVYWFFAFYIYLIVKSYRINPIIIIKKRVDFIHCYFFSQSIIIYILLTFISFFILQLTFKIKLIDHCFIILIVSLFKKVIFQLYKEKKSYFLRAGSHICFNFKIHRADFIHNLSAHVMLYTSGYIIGYIFFK